VLCAKQLYAICIIQGGSNMTGTDLCVNLATSVPVIFEPPCIKYSKGAFVDVTNEKWNTIMSY